jgi:hypothetical protein
MPEQGCGICQHATVERRTLGMDHAEAAPLGAILS